MEIGKEKDATYFYLFIYFWMRYISQEMDLFHAQEPHASRLCGYNLKTCFEDYKRTPENFKAN